MNEKFGYDLDLWIMRDDETKNVAFAVRDNEAQFERWVPCVVEKDELKLIIKYLVDLMG